MNRYLFWAVMFIVVVSFFVAATGCSKPPMERVSGDWFGGIIAEIEETGLEGELVYIDMQVTISKKKDAVGLWRFAGSTSDRVNRLLAGKEYKRIVKSPKSVDGRIVTKDESKDGVQVVAIEIENEKPVAVVESRNEEDRTRVRLYQSKEGLNRTRMDYDRFQKFGGKR